MCWSRQRLLARFCAACGAAGVAHSAPFSLAACLGEPACIRGCAPAALLRLAHDPEQLANTYAAANFTYIARFNGMLTTKQIPPA